jgi:tRNA-specific 2-thiouridylase
LGENVVPYLLAQGLNETRAHYEATRPYVQRYEQAGGGDFVIDTDFGRRITRYSSDFVEDVPAGAVLYGSFGTIRRTCKWKGNVHTTATKSPDGSMEVTRRFLNFTTPIDFNMVVEREYQPTDNNEPKFSCQEVFERVYGEGDSLEQLLQSQKDVLISPLRRVQGCVANVKVRTVLVDDRIFLDGEADAMVSRGILALLSQALAGDDVTAEDVLQLHPDSVADQLHLRQVLSKGRNDGLASMVRVVQDQIQSLLYPTTLQEENVEEVATTQVNGENHEQKQQPTVAMLLSGGVDSSVALNLLKRQNYNVTAFYLKIWLEDELAHLGQCPWEDDYRVCQEVCAQAGVPLETISLQDEYKEQVISYTVHEAERGRTPNPDIMCNSRVKFGCFYNAIEGRCFDHVASGHYAQLASSENGVKRLLRAPDPVKDQSYFLCALTQEQLDHVLFPIGEFQKTEVRELAQEFDLPNKQRPDSQGLCFLGKVRFDEFLAAYLGERPGNIIDARTGEILGRHRGVWYHTVGQRKGIGKVLKPTATARGPWYVVAKDPEHDIVYASNEYDEDVFTEARSDFYVEDIQWIAGSPPIELVDSDGSFRESRFHMKIRHGPRIAEGTLKLKDDTAGNVKLDNKDGGLAPGQYVAFYELNGSECFGGGVISERHWARFLMDREETDNVVTTLL